MAMIDEMYAAGSTQTAAPTNMQTTSWNPVLRVGALPGWNPSWSLFTQDPSAEISGNGEAWRINPEQERWLNERGYQPRSWIGPDGFPMWGIADAQGNIIPESIASGFDDRGFMNAAMLAAGVVGGAAAGLGSGSGATAGAIAEGAAVGAGSGAAVGGTTAGGLTAGEATLLGSSAAASAGGGGGGGGSVTTASPTSAGGANPYGQYTVNTGGTGGVSWLDALQGGLSAYNSYQGLQEAKAAREAMDPFGPYRKQYAEKLQQLEANPGSVANLPGFRAGLRALENSTAATGYFGSGNAAAALTEFGGNFYQQEAARLAQLAGAGATPGNGALGAAQLTGQSYASLAYGLAQLAKYWKGD